MATYSEYPTVAPVSGASGAITPSPVTASASSSPIPPQWQQPTSNGELRSVTPAMNNTRGATMYPSRGSSPANTPATISAPGSASASQYNHRNMSPQRYLPPSQQMQHQVLHNNMANHHSDLNQHDAVPSSTGLIRLTLRKPMGIVFEPMYDPNQPSVQKGVRICDLPRTGAAALSRKLEIGDELLSINDKTMSRLTFDEIMDFIIEADPEQVNLLFRRPRKEILAARNALKAAPLSNAASVKWVDEDGKNPKRDKPKSKSSSNAPHTSSPNTKKKKSPSKKERYDDDTLETYDEKPTSSKKGKPDPYENESFLDLLIDAICANPDGVCKSSDRHGEHEYDSDEDEDDDRTLTSYDDSTYVTYESEKDKKPSSTKDKSSKKAQRQAVVADSETEDDTFTDDDARHRTKMMSLMKSLPPTTKTKKLLPYEDDATLETTETTDQIITTTTANDKKDTRTPPLGLKVVPEARPAPAPERPKQVIPDPMPQQHQQEIQMPMQMLPPVEDEKNKAPITELEYDDQVDADVSVMESLGGPSLLIEQRRQQAIVPPKDTNVVPADIVNEFGAEYPADFGYTREQTIGRDPIRFYSFVVKKLLEQHEPEKVRLLDKLLAKYKGREDHLVQKLSVRYRRNETTEEQNEIASFSDAVNKNKGSPSTELAVQKAQERAVATFQGPWPEKETKEQEPVDVEGEESEEESEFSGDSIDGTSPAVIAQVSELLNYVYGKTSVPGQIDRVSTIMRAYEGREAVLLELLETKALIKANSEKENAANLPSFLRNSPALNQNREEEDMVSPLSSPNTGMNQQAVGGNIINDDISSMSGVSSPVPENGLKTEDLPPKQRVALDKPAGSYRDPKRGSSANHHSSISSANAQQTLPSSAVASKEAVASIANSKQQPQPPQQQDKKKKGIFGGLFNKKNRKGVIGGMRNKGDEQGSI